LKEGEKRAFDDDGEATATEDEASVPAKNSKKKKTANK
jgi:hypothetical protein